MLQLIEAIAQALVDHPDQVRGHGGAGERALGIACSVAKDATGHSMGPHGRTSTALRILLPATRARKATRPVLEVLEWGGHRRSTYADAADERSLRL
jgi:predicted RNA-binding protein YlqC (UPF0109 family)